MQAQQAFVEEWSSPQAIQAWWDTPEQSFFHRPYSAELVASLRDPLPSHLASSVQGRKLRKVFEKHHQNKTASVTIGALDVITSHIMADLGYDTVYVSGAVCSLTDNPTDEFNSDMADYTYDTVPKKVNQLYRSQVQHARLNTFLKYKGDPRATYVDYMVPLIADADTGHGNATANMKLAKLFVEAGAAAIHLDDQVPGTKKTGAKTAGRVLVPVSELVSRLLALKFQFDVMGSECLIIQRTDAETAGYLTSTIDARDRPFILGSTNSTLSDSLVASIASATSTPGDAEDEWVAAASLSTLDEAVRAACPDDALFATFTTKSAEQTVAQAARTARELGIAFFWDCEAARSREGWYRYRGNIDAAIMRSVACARYADVLWTRTPATVVEDLEKYAKEVKRQCGEDKWLGYNLAADVKGTDEEIKGFTSKLAGMGYVWQFLPLAGMSALAVGVERGARAVRDDGILGLVKDVNKPGKAAAVSVLEKAWQGGDLSDAMVAAVTLKKE
ncbi:isocitrate lyase [Roridomyces roridus]|uniref:Isocitrate lyase n=1 Tax=Roridomyces roridus TaxID=1738132 RepID=A0AAD7FZN6_9AGAR|nr:isocitrate lyase [Roridomyces roridus]